MSSGNRKLLINTQERAVSSDINRLQDFLGRDSAEFYRRLMLASVNGPGVENLPSTLTTPLTAEILGGFMCRPGVGTSSILVDSGIMVALSPDGTSDSSDCKYLRDDVGVQTNGTLTIAANGSGSPRIDIVEVSVDTVPNTVSDNRDIFDETTGFFQAVSVVKETQMRLSYRVRQGTAGGGFPGTVSGWLPLMVAYVPAGASNNDTCTFWDVRPLMSDRTTTMMHWEETGLDGLDGDLVRVSGTSAPITGTMRARLNGRRVGGEFRRSGPGTDAGSFDVFDAGNQGNAYVENTTTMAFVYCCTPFDLPRWARYTTGSSRVPANCRGLLVVSTVTPDTGGKPQATVGLPAAFGLSGSAATTEAICVALLPGSIAIIPWVAANKTQFLSYEYGQIQSAAISSGSCDFAVTDAVWPQNVKAALCQTYLPIVSTTANSNLTVDETLIVYEDNTTSRPAIPSIQKNRVYIGNAVASLSNYSLSSETRIPRPLRLPGASQSSPRKIRQTITLFSTGTAAFVGTVAQLGMRTFEL